MDTSFLAPCREPVRTIFSPYSAKKRYTQNRSREKLCEGNVNGIEINEWRSICEQVKKLEWAYLRKRSFGQSKGREIDG
jgi:hypothetical protein